MQGVIVQYHQTDDDNTIESRHGGLGSTGRYRKKFGVTTK